MNDYISRDAVMRLHPKNVKVVGLTAYVDAEELMELVSGIPAADVEPVRHGRWDDTCDGITPYCTVCGCSHRLMVRTPKYCPNCGAKMKGDESNDD